MPGRPKRGVRLLDTRAVGRRHDLSHERQDDNALGISLLPVPHGPGRHGHSPRPDRERELLARANSPGQGRHAAATGLIGHGSGRPPTRPGRQSPPHRATRATRSMRSFPGEANRDVRDLDNRFSTIDRGAACRMAILETPEWSDPTMFQRGSRALELFFRAWMPFQALVGEVTGEVVPVFQRVDQADTDCRSTNACLRIRIRSLSSDSITCSPNRKRSIDEIEAVRESLTREGTCLVLGPHHDVGSRPI